MTRSEMCKRLGLTEHEFNHLLEKFREFYGNLNAAQQAVVNRAVPKFEQNAAVLGGDITRDELKRFLAPPNQAAGQAPSGVAAFTQNGLNQLSNGDSNCD
jgi:hypothetical protein